MTKPTVTNNEVETAMKLAQVLLGIAASASGPVGMMGLIMATAVGGASLGIPMENLLATIDKSVTDTYAAAAKKATLN